MVSLFFGSDPSISHASSENSQRNGRGDGGGGGGAQYSMGVVKLLDDS